MATGLCNHLSLDSRVEIISAYDPDPDALAAFASHFNCRAFDELDLMCEAFDLDGVVIASPPHAHLENVYAARANGLFVFCEKPLGACVVDCHRILAAFGTKNDELFVGHVLRLFPLFMKSLELVASGEIGEVRAVSITRAGCSELFHHGWRTQKAKSGGMLMELNAHELDYMRALLGVPARVFARLDNLHRLTDSADQAFVLVEFKGGRTGMLHSSLSSPAGEYRVHIQGTSGNIVHGGFGGSLTSHPVGKEPTTWTKDELGGDDPYAMELRAWVDTLVGGGPPMFSGADGFAAVAMAEAAYISATTGKSFELTDFD